LHGCSDPDHREDHAQEETANENRDELHEWDEKRPGGRGQECHGVVDVRPSWLESLDG
jgi:hypothetical protein